MNTIPETSSPETVSYPEYVRDPGTDYPAIKSLKLKNWVQMRSALLCSMGMDEHDACVIASVEHDIAWQGDPVLDPDLIQRTSEILKKAAISYTDEQ